MTGKLFDLNIEEILDNWEVHHAIREVIANALDEQLLTETRSIEIDLDDQGTCHICDFGRGIRIEHFTLNENVEKTKAPEGIIGKFGVGLKDALATFNRHGIEVNIISCHGTFLLKEAYKHGFDNIKTLHIEYDETPLRVVGTEVILHKVTNDDVDKAKSLFMAFSQEEVIETTGYGQVIKKKGDEARVYINGVLANEEPKFLFSYNITSLTEAMRKRLNRERLNVGRTTYTDRVKAILRSASSSQVQDALADQVFRRAIGDQCDEMQWLEVSQLAFNYLNQKSKVAYVTEWELTSLPNVIDHIRSDGFTPVVVSDAHKERIDTQIEAGGPKLRTIETYIKDFNLSFQYSFIDPRQLTKFEQKVFEQAQKIIELLLIPFSSVPSIKISETMRIGTDNTAGVWDPLINAIVIQRNQLISPEAFAGTLLHEVIHATSNESDLSRQFEVELSTALGKIAIIALRRDGINI